MGCHLVKFDFHSDNIANTFCLYLQEMTFASAQKTTASNVARRGWKIASLFWRAVILTKRCRRTLARSGVFLTTKPRRLTVSYSRQNVQSVKKHVD